MSVLPSSSKLTSVAQLRNMQSICLGWCRMQLSWLVQNAVEQRKALGDFVDKDNEDGLGIGRSASGQECHLQPRVPCEQQQIARHLYHTSLHAMPGKLKVVH